MEETANKFAYELVEKNENPYESKIKKSGITIEFTYRQFLSEQRQLERDLKELRSNKAIADAIVQNIETHHEFVKTFTDEQLSVLNQYYISKNRSKELTEPLAETQEAFDLNKKELELLSELFDIPEIEPEIKETKKDEQNLDTASEQA